MGIIAVAICLSFLVVSSRQRHSYEATRLNIIVLLDNSGSIGHEDYKKYIDFIGKLPETFKIEPDQAHVAIVRFDWVAQIVLNFTSSKDEFLHEVEELRSRTHTGGTNTYLGLETILEVVLPNAKRPDLPTILIIFTDGCPTMGGPIGKPDNWHKSYTDAMNETEKLAKELQEKKVTIFVVHVGLPMCTETSPPVNATEHEIKVTGDEKRQFGVDGFDDLTKKIFDDVKEQIEKEQCVYEKICLYDERKECKGEEKKKPNQPKCLDSYIPGEVPCDPIDCEKRCNATKKKECNDWWCQGEKACDACKRCFVTVATTDQSTSSSEETSTASWTVSIARAVNGNGKSSGAPDPDDGKWSIWKYVSIALGSLAFLLIVVFVIVLVVVRSRRKKQRLAVVYLKKKAEGDTGAPQSQPHGESVKTQSNRSSAHPSTGRSGHPLTSAQSRSGDVRGSPSRQKTAVTKTGQTRGSISGDKASKGKTMPRDPAILGKGQAKTGYREW